MNTAAVLIDVYGPVILTALLLAMGWAIRQVHGSYTRLTDKVDRLTLDVLEVRDVQRGIVEDVQELRARPRAR